MTDSIHSCGPYCTRQPCMEARALELDAARYRFLRGQELNDPEIYVGVDSEQFKNRWALGAGDESKIDEAIDAAMAQQKGTK
jgi:hypothetical protein